ncbi:LOW QUALITY PROTEIN: hypothetical protein RTBOTA2_004556 [Rhodotorula toruloides]|nr:LOW QUALITY PROTEIN: hypothetical protein RTBOTA2_004556 [Rhodotorula toruloides]
MKEQPLLAQEWAGKMVAHWAGWREREGLGEAVGGLKGEGGKKEDGAGAGEAAAAGGAAERNGGDETKQAAAASSAFAAARRSTRRTADLETKEAAKETSALGGGDGWNEQPSPSHPPPPPPTAQVSTRLRTREWGFSCRFGLSGGHLAPVPSQRTQPSLPAQPALFPSLPLLSSSSSSSAHTSTLPTRSMGTPFEAGVGGEGQPRARASFAFPSSMTTTTTALPPAYFPPPPPPAQVPRPSLPYTPHRSSAFNSDTSDSDSDLSTHPSSNPSSALAGPALEKARADFLARDWAYRAGGSGSDGDEEEGKEKGRARERGRESDAEWVPECEAGGGEGRAAGVSTKGKGRKRGVEAGGAGGAAGGGVVTEPATEPLSLRWIPSLRAFLPSTSPYRSLSPTHRSTTLTFPPSSYIRVFTSSSRAPESEVFPYSTSSLRKGNRRNGTPFYERYWRIGFPPLLARAGLGSSDPQRREEEERVRGSGRNPLSFATTWLAYVFPIPLPSPPLSLVLFLDDGGDTLGEEEEGVRRMCALERGVGEKVGKGKGREKEKAQEGGQEG